MPKIDINFADYLDTASLLISLEVARLTLGDKLRRGAILVPMGMSESEADIIRQRLNSLMNAIRSTEKLLPEHDFQARESGTNEDTE